MQLDLEKPDGNIIRSYSPGELRVNNLLLHDPVILTVNEIHTAWAPSPIRDLSLGDFEIALTKNPELILFGTGPAQHFPPPAVVTAIMKRGIGFEFMDTAAACRTFNVLASEHRQVVAALLLA